MSNNISVSKPQSSRNDVRIKVLLNKLRTKLKGLAVMDQQGFLLGEVKEVGLDAERQLNLLVSLTTSEPNSNLVLIRSKHIQQVDPTTKSLFIDLSQADIEQLPAYVRPQEESAVEKIPVVSAQTTTESTYQFSSQAPDRSETSVMSTSTELENNQESLIPGDESLQDTTAPLDIVEEEIIRLLGERLVVDTTKQKVGEVIVRKQIETRMVQVPIRREILIVEQVSPERKQLAEIDLGQAQSVGVELTETGSIDDQLKVSGEFGSPKTASRILDAIAHQHNHGCSRVRVEIILEDGEHQKTYQEWFDRCSSQS